MARKEAYVVFAISILVHVIVTLNIPSYLVNNADSTKMTNEINTSIGIFLLLFPLFGFVADVCLTRYRMIQLSIMFTIVALILVLSTGTLTMIVVDTEFVTVYA